MIANPVAGADRRIPGRHADVDVEAEGELPQEGLPVRVRKRPVPRLAGDDLILPVREGVGTAPGEEQPASRGRAGDPAQLRLEVAPGLVDAPADVGADLDAACVELTLDRVGQGRGKFGDDAVDPVPEGQRVRVDELELQLDADGRRGAGTKRMIEHGEALDALDCVGSAPRWSSVEKCLGWAARTSAVVRAGMGRLIKERANDVPSVGKCGKAAGSGDVGVTSRGRTSTDRGDPGPWAGRDHQRGQMLHFEPGPTRSCRRCRRNPCPSPRDCACRSCRRTCSRWSPKCCPGPRNARCPCRSSRRPRCRCRGRCSTRPSRSSPSPRPRSPTRCRCPRPPSARAGRPRARTRARRARAGAQPRARAGAARAAGARGHAAGPRRARRGADRPAVPNAGRPRRARASRVITVAADREGHADHARDEGGSECVLQVDHRLSPRISGPPRGTARPD